MNSSLLLLFHTIFLASIILGRWILLTHLRPWRPVVLAPACQVGLSVALTGDTDGPTWWPSDRPVWCWSRRNGLSGRADMMTRRVGSSVSGQPVSDKWHWQVTLMGRPDGHQIGPCGAGAIKTRCRVGPTWWAVGLARVVWPLVTSLTIQQ